MELFAIRTAVALMIAAVALMQPGPASASTVGRRHRHQRGRDKRQHPTQYILDESGGPAEPESGPWGPWTAPSLCSRSCGGGVAYQTRQCMGSEACQGASKRYFSCNIQFCPEGSIEFRTEQCSHFNDIPFDGVTYTWIPYTKAANKCELNCMPRGERFYYRHKDKVIDGTPCEEEKLNVCVDGKCLPVGCDGLLGSSAREDECRDCGGDGGGCQRYQGTLDQPDMQVGYNDLLLIPAGAMNIRVREATASNNYLAIRNESGHYYLNGNWRIDFPRSTRACGTVIHYERNKNVLFVEPEVITALGPITEPIYIVLLYQERNPGVEYEYYLPKGSVQGTDHRGYSWMAEDFGPCSATCGEGRQERRVWCAKRDELSEVSADLCLKELRPMAEQRCQLEPCPAAWSAGEWAPCSQTCGQGGTQLRQVICSQMTGYGEIPVSRSECEVRFGSPPPNARDCADNSPCPTYHVGPWKPCDRLCGDGKQKRDVICFRTVNGKIEKMSDESCPGEKPPTETPCNLRPCEGVDWVTTDWSGCEDKCGLAYESRQVYCATEKGAIHPDRFCKTERTPELKRECNSTAACEHVWFASQWSQCSARCGTGVQTRKVFCGTYMDEGVSKAEEANCDATAKYSDTRNCTAADREECNGSWVTGPWTACSKPCGGGSKSRKVLCTLNNQTAAKEQCDNNDFPSMNEQCNNVPCGSDQLITVAPEHKVDVDDDDKSKEEDDELPYCDEEEEKEDGGEEEDDMDGEGAVFTPKPGVAPERLEAEPEGSGSSTNTDDLFTLSSDTSETMLSDEPSSSGMSDTDTTLIVTFDSSESTAWLTSDEGSGESPTSTEAASSSESSSASSTDHSQSSEDVLTSTSSVDTSAASDPTMTIESSETSTVLETDFTTSHSESSSQVSETSDSPSPSASDESSESSTQTSEMTTEQTESSSYGSTESSTSEDATESTLDLSSSANSLSSAASSEPSSISSTEVTSSIEQSSSEVSTAESDLGTESSSESQSSTELVSSTDVFSESSSLSSVSTEATDVSSSFSTSKSTDGSSSLSSSELSTETSVGSESSTESTSESESYSSETSTSYRGSTTEYSSIFYTVLSTTPEAKRKCRLRPKKAACLSSEFGCCQDNTTMAQGPFNKGCPAVETCSDTNYGCCPDGVSPASGRKGKGCPPSQCEESLFGCCDDGMTDKQGNEGEGCPQPTTTTTTTSCNDTRFGCCPDGETPATGHNKEGCDVDLSTVEPVTEAEVDCAESTYGCCPDNKTAAKWDGECPPDNQTDCSQFEFGCCPDGVTQASGASGEGCAVASCAMSAFGCCEDNATAAHGPNREGCCLLTRYGCCPDNVRPALDSNLEGCGCQYAAYGCCPDGATTAGGPDNRGCGCQFTQYGCCPDGHHPATGPSLEGCACNTYQFGCCPDGVTRAVGPNAQGCGCEETEFKCCGDGKTPASGPAEEAGCSCAASAQGCCPDGVTPAQGDNFDGCDDRPLQPGELCTLQKDRGSCREFTVKWFFDVEYGGCSRFWYGGCDGNGNRFKTQDECKQTCVEPPGRDPCFLPKIEGPCDGYHPTWYYDQERRQCGQFVYGGCLGNGNRFETHEACEQLCVTPDTIDACEKSLDSGPCQGNFTRWFFDKESGSCSEFKYGGCKGNDNNFLTRIACEQKCLRGRPVIGVCGLEKDSGPCLGAMVRWYFDYKSDVCRQFMYGGCQGNANRFRSEAECARHCGFNVVAATDVCSLPLDPGQGEDKSARWYFSAKPEDNICRPFYYSGAGGNTNNFATEEHCEHVCPPVVEVGVCGQPASDGPCRNYTVRWYYDTLESQCRQFYYGGCEGNGNNFLTQQQCEGACVGGGRGEQLPPPPPQTLQTTAAPPPQQPPAFTKDMCLLANERGGDCQEEVTLWYYDSRYGVCQPFNGCPATVGNRFNTREDCEYYCGDVQDACSLPPYAGPCNGNETQYYYDDRADACAAFDYGGCGGNGNRFPTAEACERQCQRRAPPPPPPTPPPPAPLPQPTQPPKPANCYLPPDQGPCHQNVTAWFYDVSIGRCQAFVYGNCEGNDNRFSSVEECERSCGEFIGRDVCNEQVDVGACDQRQVKWHFDAQTSTCQEFAYGGCGGSANRFSTEQECQNLCVYDPDVICKLPIDVGYCRDDPSTRWGFDEAKMACIDFTYHPCGGNLNRFTSFDACMQYCSPGTYTRPPIQNTIGPDPVCPSASECGTRQCPYGESRWTDAGGCERCKCYDPCDAVGCPGPRYRCAVVPQRDPRTDDIEYKPVCKEVTKRGDCPVVNHGDGYNCTDECEADVECPGATKCCHMGCSTVCMEPVEGAGPPPPPTSAPPPEPPSQPGSVPEIQTDTPEVEADEGYFVTLRCVARSNPPPTVIWIRGAAIIKESGSHYKILADDSLQIIGIVQSDAGEYVCQADNGIATTRKTFHVRVRGARDRQATVLGDPDQSVVVSLGSRATLQCYAFGFPTPAVTWWRGDRMLPLMSSELEQRRDFSLLLNAVSLASLGPYTCQAYNGKGRAASWTVILKAYGSAYSPDVNDVSFNQFLVPSPVSPEGAPAYRPPPPPVPTRPPEIVQPRKFVVPVNTTISMDKTTFPVDSDISIPCDVDGYPLPQVQWYKDDLPLQPSERIQISESSRLTVVRANVNDSGTYRCEAANQYSSAHAVTTISVEGIYVHPLCTDNTFFADCNLVVTGKFCTHRYYSKFCCRACTLAGQLPSHGPHLDGLERRRRRRSASPHH